TIIRTAWSDRFVLYSFFRRTNDPDASIRIGGRRLYNLYCHFYPDHQSGQNPVHFFYNAQRGTAAIKRIEEILQADIAIKEPEHPQAFPSFEHSIEFRNVSFRYEDAEVLHNINLRIAKGKTVALVGSSGAGKSTLADLIPRFHDVSSGELLLDGVNIREYSPHAVRKQMSIVTQEPILFNDTIAANIALGTPDASLMDIEQAAMVANAHSFISQKED